MYEDPATKQRKWIAGNNPAPKGFVQVAKTYRKKGQKLGPKVKPMTTAKPRVKKAELLEKVAAKKKAEPEKEHAIEASKQLEESGGQILHWSTGAGKTRQFLKHVEKALSTAKKDERALIIAPASLTTNVDKELDKHGIKIDRSKLDVLSYEKATNDAHKLRKNKYAITIADEAQKLRNADTKRTKELSDILSSGKRRILATATANYNKPSDIAPLLNIAAGERVLPEDPKQFDKAFLKEVHRSRTVWERALGVHPEPTIEIQNRAYLKQLFKKHLHHYDSKHDPEAQKKFPKVTHKVVEVEMSPEQERMYKFVEGDIPFLLRMKIRHNLPLDKKEKAEVNSFSNGVRQVSNSHRHLDRDPSSVAFTPKIQRATSSLMEKMQADKNFRGLVYSNYLEAGLHEYSRKLQQHKIKHHVYTGKLNRSEKDAMVKDYNEGKVPVLLVSSSGAEGLDLKGTKLTQVLEPHWNPARVEQVVGRSARYESHTHLPENERHVEVEHYRSVLPKPTFGKAAYSIDKYLSENSDDKSQVFGKIKSIMREATEERRD